MGKRTLYSLESDIRRILEGNDFISTCDEGGKPRYMNLVTDLAIFVQQEIEKAREEKIQNIFTREECVIVEPRYISDWSDKYNKHFKCNRCKSKCLIPVIEPLVVICPKCGELDLDEIS